jgi:hypothetical protein
MIKEKFEPVDLTELTNDEIHHLGTCFLRDLKAVLDQYRPYFITHYYYKTLDDVLGFVRNHLEWEESRVE